MNDNFNIYSSDGIDNCDVPLAAATNVTEESGQTDMAGRAVSGTDSLTVPDMPVSRLKNFISKYWFALAILVLSVVFMCFSLKSNAAEITYSIDNVVNNQFANFPYRFIARNGDNYMIFYSDRQIYYTGSRYACNGGSGTCGYTSLIIENNVLVVKPSSSSSTFDLSTGKVEMYVYGYSEIIWSSYDVPIGNLSNDSYIQTGIHFDTSNNAVYVPDVSDDIENDSTENTTGCKFTDENIVESINVLNKDLVAKMDIVIMLLIVMIAIRMFSPLANNHKRGLGKKGE